MTLLKKVLLLFASGGAGTLGRFGLLLALRRLPAGRFTWPTIIVNFLGCFLVGLVVELAAERWQWDAHTSSIILIGFFGAFTTFSAVILEALRLGQSGDWLWAAVYIVVQNVLGLGGIIGGVNLGRVLA